MATKSQTSKLVLGILSFLIHILLNILFYVIVVMLITKYSGIAFDFAYQVFGDVKPVQVTREEPKKVTIKIQKSESTMSIARKLEINKVIDNRYSFYLRAKLNKANIKTGRYVVDTSMTYKDILNVITNYENNLDKDEDAKDSRDTSKKNVNNKTSSNASKAKTNNP